MADDYSCLAIANTADDQRTTGQADWIAVGPAQRLPDAIQPAET